MSVLEKHTAEIALPRPTRTGGILISSLKFEAALALLLLGAVAVIGVLSADVRHSALSVMEGFWGNYFGDFFRSWLLNPLFYIAFGLALTLERFFPAKLNQSRFSSSFWHDCLWTFVLVGVSVIALPLTFEFLKHTCKRSFLTPFETFPVPARWCIAFLIADFTAYLAHVLRHKIGLLWQFHAVHHSQEELNFFSESRRHPIDQSIVYVRLFLPFFLLHLPFEVLFMTFWWRRWHERLYHSNIKTNLGWLRYILVTPQSHRVHHSKLAEHRDLNFGETLSIWDHLFGTQCREYDQYPETGVDDEDFPLEREEPLRTVFDHLLLIGKQLVYPFKKIVRS